MRRSLTASRKGLVEAIVVEVVKARKALVVEEVAEAGVSGLENSSEVAAGAALL